jgi:putative endonuclease
MFNDKIKLGKLGEQIAEKYLKNKGYKIIDKNFYARCGEIDIIAKKDKVIHFIEVKTRTNKSFGWPEEAVNEDKLEKIAETAELYLAKNEINAEWQIDIVGIILGEKKEIVDIKYIKNA